MEEQKELYIGQHTRPEEKKYKEWDTLGFNEAKEAFLSAIKNINVPMTVGLYGPWGSGKTEMIKALSQELTEGNESEYISLIFDAWKYRHEQNLILPLICLFEKKVYSIIGKRGIIYKWFRERWEEVKLFSPLSLVLSNQFIKKFIGIDFYSAEKDTKEKNLKQYKKYIDNIEKIENEYKEFIENIIVNVKKRKKKVIIFIDNLDRCLPDIVVNLLEDISCFLSIKDTPCIYVLAMDRENVINAVKNKYKDFDGAHYLEKIVQIGLNMPSSIKRPDQDSSWTTTHFMKRYEFAKGYTEVSQRGDSRDQMHVVLNKMSYVFNSEYLANPRRIERIVNKIIVLEKMESISAERIINDIPILIFLILLKEHFFEVYDSLFFDEAYRDLHNSFKHAKNHFSQNKAARKKYESRDSFSADAIISNNVISRYYFDDDKYFYFLCLFMDLFYNQNITEKFKVYKKHLELIG